MVIFWKLDYFKNWDYIFFFCFCYFSLSLYHRIKKSKRWRWVFYNNLKVISGTGCSPDKEVSSSTVSYEIKETLRIEWVTTLRDFSNPSTRFASPSKVELVRLSFSDILHRSIEVHGQKNQHGKSSIIRRSFLKNKYTRKKFLFLKESQL